MVLNTTRKLINTNKNIDEIFSSVNYWRFLPMEIYLQYIPRELQWEKQFKQWKKKMMTCHFLPTESQTKNTEGIFTFVNFRGILPTEIFSRYIPRELLWGKKLKQSNKKMMTCHFYLRNYRRNKLWILFIMSFTKGITNGKFRRYFPESSRTVHSPIALLITVF